MSLMMAFRPCIISAVERVNSAVSSRPVAWGTGEDKSPSTSSFMRSAQARIGMLMLLDSFTATIIEARLAPIITSTFRNIPTYVSVR